jgi:hypothetical protein
MKTARRFDRIFIDLVITPIKHVKNQIKTIVSPAVHSMEVSPCFQPQRGTYLWPTSRSPNYRPVVHNFNSQFTCLMTAQDLLCASRGPPPFGCGAEHSTLQRAPQGALFFVSLHRLGDEIFAAGLTHYYVGR